MPVNLGNNAVSRLASSLSSGSTSLSVTAGEGGKFPSPAAGDWFPLTIVKASGALEILRCTARSGDVFTVVRAQEATAAQSFAAGDRVELRFTAAAFADLVSALNTFKNSLGTASVKNAQATPVDAAAGALMMVGAFGLGAELASTEANMNNYIIPGSYITPATGLTSMPVGAVTTESHAIIVVGGTNYIAQLLISTGGGNAWFRSSSFSGLSAAPWHKIIHADNVAAVDAWAVQPIGVPIPLFTHLTGVAEPPTNKEYRYIKLTAADAYNTGVLTSESVTGSAPLVLATAAISLVGSPITGQSVSLINTERRALRAGSSGTVEADAFQGHLFGNNGFPGPLMGMFVNRVGGTGVSNTSQLVWTSSVSDVVTDGGILRVVPVSDTVNGTPRIANETRSKSIGATYYMRIK